MVLGETFCPLRDYIEANDENKYDDYDDYDNDFDAQVMVAAETSCPLRDYIEADCKNLVGLVSRMKDRY